ncbi:MAG: putative glycoside hydrolase [Syntrophobacterales bacterium]
MKKICIALLIPVVVLLFAALAPAQTGKSGDKPQAAEAPAAPAAKALEAKAPEGKTAEASQAPDSKTGEAAQVPQEQGKEAPPAPTQPASAAAKAYTGKVVDAVTKRPIANAPVTLGDKMVRTDQDGTFSVEGVGEVLRLRAAGYARRDVPLSELGGSNSEIALDPLKVKALYLTVYGAASKKIRGAALAALERNNMNALVIDVKGDRGFIPFKVDIPLAEQVGAQKTILIKDYPAFLQKLKDQGLYLIARIVVFKDNPLATAKPQWAVKKMGGGIFLDREKLRWTDPFIKEVWDYNIAIAKAAAEVGFDEIQFDYVRFPDSRKTSLSKPANVETRTKAITGFLEAAYKALIPYNVFVAADIFGYVPWNENDTDIGQQIVPVMNAVDIVSLMVYPSGYHLGIPKYRNPVQHPYEIVYLTLKRAQARTKVSPLRFRPWLQAFRDYAYRGGDFTEARMRTQIKAADDFGASGWMFWNPRNQYPTGVFSSGNGTKKKSRPTAASPPSAATPAKAPESGEPGQAEATESKQKGN